jgi:hypothetical protein
MNADDWKELAKAIPEETVIGDIVHGESIRAFSVADVIRFVEASPLARVAVEEQHHTSYILHLGNEPGAVWLSVDSASPIFPELQRLHGRWKIEHPGWDGWMAF